MPPGHPSKLSPALGTSGLGLSYSVAPIFPADTPLARRETEAVPPQDSMSSLSPQRGIASPAPETSSRKGTVVVHPKSPTPGPPCKTLYRAASWVRVMDQ